MKEYSFNLVEKKWQKKWEQGKIFEVKADPKKVLPSGITSSRSKFYNLEMFPYPSASGLHMGHALNFSIGDVYARFKRMRGFNVLYPMGFDALGLPAENAAIKAGEHPKPFTEKAIKNYVKQMKEMGLSYDWSKTLATMDPRYYKWNQFWFLKFLETGLIYRKKAPVNWCPKCNTVLANEQVQNGKCWRHEDTEIEIKHLEQWYLKTTKYAEELLDKIDELDWPEKIKLMQKNWIGKSHGTEIDFEIETPSEISNVVIVHGCPDSNEPRDPEKRTYEKHWRLWLIENLKKKNIQTDAPLMPEPWAPDYKKWKKEFDKLNINEESVLIGHSCGCAFLVRWLGDTKKKIKKLILVAPWKIAYRKDGSDRNFYEYKIGDSVKSQTKEVIIFTSDDEEKDGKESVKIFHDSLGGNVIELKNHGHFTFGDMGTYEFPELLDGIVSNKKFPIFTTRPDTIFGVTFMVVSAQHPKLFDLVTEEQKKDIEKFLKKIKSVSEKELEDMEKEGVFTGSYAINPVTEERIPVYAGNFVVADYGSGMVMAVPAHDQRDFKFAKKYKIEVKQVIDGEITKDRAYTGSGILINSEKFNGLNNEEARKKITEYLEKKKLGRKVIQYKLRDWGFSRQRYWGTPIPIINCSKCGLVPVPFEDLPVKLPDKIEFGKGNPLETNEKWINVKCPKCKGKAKREPDTMDTFFDSSWYYLRYPDNQNEKEPFSKKNIDYWLPVDQYIGGAEHACMHLIYARFFTKALRDLGYLNFDEPFTRLFNQGMLHGADGEKMSKSRGNVINPDEVSKKYGMDTARFFLLSLATPEKDRDWSEEGIQGSLKLIRNIFNKFETIKIGKSNPKTISKLNKIIKEVTNQIESFKYNLAIIKIRELFNSFGEEESKDALEKSLKLLHPFCPHITEELWEKIGGKGFISLAKWPEADESKIDENLEKQEEMIKKIVSDIINIKNLTGDKNPCVYIYAVPQDFPIIKENENVISNLSGSAVSSYSVTDPLVKSGEKDPQRKAKKAKLGRPGIYLE